MLRKWLMRDGVWIVDHTPQEETAPTAPAVKLIEVKPIPVTLVHLGLSYRIRRMLGKAGVTTAAELSRLSAEDLKSLGGFGPDSIRQVREAMSVGGFWLRDDPPLPQKPVDYRVYDMRHPDDLRFGKYTGVMGVAKEDTGCCYCGKEIDAGATCATVAERQDLVTCGGDECLSDVLFHLRLNYSPPVAGVGGRAGEAANGRVVRGTNSLT